MHDELQGQLQQDAWDIEAEIQSDLWGQDTDWRGQDTCCCSVERQAAMGLDGEVELGSGSSSGNLYVDFLKAWPFCFVCSLSASPLASVHFCLVF